MPHVLAIATRSHTEAVAKEIGQMLDRREAGRDIWTRTSCRWPPEESPQCGFLCLRYASSSVDVPHRGVGLLTKDFVGSNDRHDQGEKQKFACLLRSDRRPALRLFHDDSRTPSGETDRRKFPASRSLLRSHRRHIDRCRHCVLDRSQLRWPGLHEGQSSVYRSTRARRRKCRPSGLWNTLRIANPGHRSKLSNYPGPLCPGIAYEASVCVTALACVPDASAGTCNFPVH